MMQEVIEEPKSKRKISSYREGKDKEGSVIRVPVIDVRDSEEHRETAENFIKAGNGPRSKYHK